MHLQRFLRPTVKEALAAARENLGPDALVLSTELVQAPGWRGWTGQRVVAITAGTEKPVSESRTSETEDRQGPRVPGSQGPRVRGFSGSTVRETVMELFAGRPPQDPRTLGPSDPGTLGPSDLGTLGPWDPRTFGPSAPGTTSSVHPLRAAVAAKLIASGVTPKLAEAAAETLRIGDCRFASSDTLHRAMRQAIAACAGGAFEPARV